jgi:hypothetical protein
MPAGSDTALKSTETVETGLGVGGRGVSVAALSGVAITCTGALCGAQAPKTSETVSRINRQNFGRFLFIRLNLTNKSRRNLTL